MEKFKITINGIEFEKLAAYSLSFQDIKNVTQTADGTNVVSLVSTKTKISVSFTMMPNEELIRINNVIVVDGVNKVDYYDYTKGAYVNKNFYVDDRSASIATFDNEGNPIWQEFALSFIEA